MARGHYKLLNRRPQWVLAAGRLNGAVCGRRLRLASIQATLRIHSVALLSHKRPRPTPGKLGLHRGRCCAKHRRLRRYFRVAERVALRANESTVSAGPAQQRQGSCGTHRGHPILVHRVDPRLAGRFAVPVTSTISTRRQERIGAKVERSAPQMAGLADGCATAPTAPQSDAGAQESEAGRRTVAAEEGVRVASVVAGRQRVHARGAVAARLLDHVLARVLEQIPPEHQVRSHTELTVVHEGVSVFRPRTSSSWRSKRAAAAGCSERHTPPPPSTPSRT